MRKGQRLELADLEALPVGARVLDWAHNILLKQGDGTFKYEDGGQVISAPVLDKAYGRACYYDAPDVEAVPAEESKRLHPSNGAAALIFDGPPGHQSGRFIEAVDEQGRSIKVGEWRNRGDGTWELRLDRPTWPAADQMQHTLWCRGNHEGPCRRGWASGTEKLQPPSDSGDRD